MAEHEFKTQKLTITLTVIMAILLVVSMLSFFGVYDVTEIFITHYCRVSSKFECTELKVTPGQISFKLKSRALEMQDITITPFAKSCTEQMISKIQAGTSTFVKLNCGQTAPKGKIFEDNIEMQYKLKDKIRFETDEIMIKSKVVSK